jgi:hypothetical protein
MRPVMNELQEVIIKDTINAVSLGIVPANQKKIFGGRKLKIYRCLSKMNPMGFDPVLNLIVSNAEERVSCWENCFY